MAAAHSHDTEDNISSAVTTRNASTIRNLLVELAQNRRFRGKESVILGEDLFPFIKELIGIIHPDGKKPNTYFPDDGDSGAKHIILSEAMGGDKQRSKQLILPELQQALQNYLAQQPNTGIFSSSHTVRVERLEKQIKLTVTDREGNVVATFSAHPLVGLDAIAQGLLTDLKVKQQEILDKLNKDKLFRETVKRYVTLANPGQPDDRIPTFAWDEKTKEHLLNVLNSEGKVVAQIDFTGLRAQYTDPKASQKAVERFAKLSSQFLIVPEAVSALQQVIDNCVDSLQVNKSGLQFFLVPEQDSTLKLRLCVTNGPLLKVDNVYSVPVTQERLNALVEASKDITTADGVRNFNVSLFEVCNDGGRKFINHSLYHPINVLLTAKSSKLDKNKSTLRNTLSQQSGLLGSLAVRDEPARVDARNIFPGASTESTETVLLNTPEGSAEESKKLKVPPVPSPRGMRKTEVEPKASELPPSEQENQANFSAESPGAAILATLAVKNESPRPSPRPRRPQSGNPGSLETITGVVKPVTPPNQGPDSPGS